MSSLNGFIKLHRKLIAWGWYQDNPVKCLFLHLLLTANFTNTEWRGRELKAGQVVTGIKKLSADLGFSEQQIRTALNKLKSTREITVESTNKYSIITVTNWEEYQSDDKSSTSKTTNKQKVNQQTNNKQITSKQHSNNKQATNKQQQRKNNKNIKNGNNDKNSLRACAREDGDGIYLDPEIWGESLKIMRGEK